jgi:transcriptional regulator with XRE-family HTH domain
MDNQSLDELLGDSVDEEALKRLSDAVRECRGERSQRDFAADIGVAQTTVLGWEAARNAPSLDNLEKIARLRGELIESFIAYLYGRDPGESLDLLSQVKATSKEKKAEILRIIADDLLE